MKKLVIAGLSVAGAAASTADVPMRRKEKKVCRSAVVTGSIMAHSTCHTKGEWAHIDAANAQSVENARNMQSGASGTH